MADFNPLKQMVLFQDGLDFTNFQRTFLSLPVLPAL